MSFGVRGYQDFLVVELSATGDPSWVQQDYKTAERDSTATHTQVDLSNLMRLEGEEDPIIGEGILLAHLFCYSSTRLKELLEKTGFIGTEEPDRLLREGAIFSQRYHQMCREEMENNDTYFKIEFLTFETEVDQWIDDQLRSLPPGITKNK